jgi:MraZ protein
LSFTGEFRHTIDAKGRLIVPSRMRDELDGDVAVLVTYLDGCIAMFSKEGFERFEQQLMGLERSKEGVRDLIRNVASGTHDDEVDKQGRITVPVKLRQYAEIERDVVIAGAFDHAEIWNPQRYAQHQLDEQGLNERAQELSF